MPGLVNAYALAAPAHLPGVAVPGAVVPGAVVPGAVVIESPLPTGRASPRSARDQIRPIDPINHQERARSADTRVRGRQSAPEQAQKGRSDAGQPETGRSATPTASRPFFSAANFAAQQIGQESVSGPDQGEEPSAQKLARGHLAYRRAGGEPALYAEGAALFRLSA